MAKCMVKFDNEKCKGCELCISACPVKIIKLQEKELNVKGYRTAHIEEMDRCIGCGSCALMCPDGVISVYKE